MLVVVVLRIGLKGGCSELLLLLLLLLSLVGGTADTAVSVLEEVVVEVKPKTENIDDEEDGCALTGVVLDVTLSADPEAEPVR